MDGKGLRAMTYNLEIQMGQPMGVERPNSKHIQKLKVTGRPSLSVHYSLIPKAISSAILARVVGKLGVSFFQTAQVRLALELPFGRYRSKGTGGPDWISFCSILKLLPFDLFLNLT